MKCLLPLLLLISCNAKKESPQVIKKVFDPANSTHGFYTIIEPRSGKPDILLVLLDGLSGNAENFLPETRIDEVGYENNVLTVCIPTGIRLYPDSTILNRINTTIGEVINKYHIPKDRIAMGGFSIGGTIVLRYAELSKEDPVAFPFSPQAVFTGDSPIDLAGLYRSSKTELQKNFKGPWLDEARMIIDSLRGRFGEPENNKEAWQRINPFNATDTAIGNERYMVGIAYRTYHDIDVQWQLETRGRSLYQVNAPDASEMVSRLRLQGNRNASFIQSKIPGRLPNGQHQTHAWNIINAEELVEWLRASVL